MSMSGSNYAQRYGSNPYLENVGSPLTTQGEVTHNCRTETAEVTTRRRNMENNAHRAVSYPGGDVIDHLQVVPSELVFGWINRQGRNQIPGHPNHIGFSSLNGVKWGDTSTDAELEMRIRFIGLAKTPYLFDNAYQLKHGFTAIGVGSGTTRHTGDEEIFPGDRLFWEVIPRPVRNPADPMAEARLPGGQFGDSGPGSRQGNPRRGTPRGKLLFIIRPSRFNDMRPPFEGMISTAFKTMATNGIADRPFEHLFNDYSLGESPKPGPLQEFAMATLTSNAVMIALGVKLLADQGLDLNATAAAQNTEALICNHLGCFSTKPAERQNFRKLINGLYMGLQVNRSGSAQYANNLRRRYDRFFDRKQRVVRNTTTESRFLQVAMNLHTYQTVGYARAVHVIARKRFCTALSHATKGQRLDILIGHFQETF